MYHCKRGKTIQHIQVIFSYREIQFFLLVVLKFIEYEKWLYRQRLNRTFYREMFERKENEIKEKKLREEYEKGEERRNSLRSANENSK